MNIDKLTWAKRLEQSHACAFNVAVNTPPQTLKEIRCLVYRWVATGVPFDTAKIELSALHLIEDI